MVTTAKLEREPIQPRPHAPENKFLSKVDFIEKRKQENALKARVTKVKEETEDSEAVKIAKAKAKKQEESIARGKRKK